MNKRSLWWSRLALIVTVMIGGLGLLPALSAAQGLLETPQPGSFQSGIGLIRGWVCSANRVDIEVVGRGTLQAVYREPRGDTQSTCGDTDNGFSIQFNWNDLGEGIHTVRALADGTEFGRAQVTVATLGQTFLQGAQGEFVVQPFPQSGQQTRIRWQESRQVFVLSNGGTPASGGGNPRADALLEDPQPGSFQSGIGPIRGWVCNASRVDIELDGQPAVPAVYRQPRGDTQTICGDTDNGFSLQVNWNDVDDGAHTVRALADGVEFGQATFTVVTLGLGSFPTGLVGNFPVTNFPRTGMQTQVQWQESQQNFVVTGSRFPGLDEGLCTTRTGQASDGSGGAADIAWGNPCLLSGNTAVLRVQTRNTAALIDEDDDRDERAAEGGAFFACASNLTIRQGSQTFDSSNFRLVDVAGNEVCRDIPPGTVINLLLQVNAQSDLNFNASFTVLYNGQTLVDFPAATPSGAPKLAVSASELSFSTTTQGVVAASSSAPLAVSDVSLVRDERSQAAGSQDKNFTVTNTGGGTLQGGMTLIASDSGGQAFQIVSGGEINLGAGLSQVVTVRFTPVSAEPVVGSIRITTNGGVKSILLSAGQQNEPEPSVTASVTFIDFGTVLINSSPERSFTATNKGGGTLTGSVDPTPNSPFSVVAGGTLNLTAGQSQTVTIRLTPKVTGQLNDRVTLNTNGGTFVVLLLANVVNSPRLSVSPEELDFGTVQLPNSATRTLTITNTGGGTLTGNVNVSNPVGASASFSLISGGSFNLGANQSQTVTLSFSPKAPGTFTGTADVSSNGGSASVSLSGTAMQPPPTLSVTPPSIDFGTLPNNQCTSQSSSFQVRNIGGGTLTGSVTTSLPFIINSPSSFSLGAGQSQTIGVTWRPTGTGTDTGVANISSNGGSEVVSLSGRCTIIITIVK